MAAHTFMVDEVDLTFFLSSRERTPEMMFRRPLNHFFFLKKMDICGNEFISVSEFVFSCTRPVSFQSTT